MTNSTRERSVPPGKTAVANAEAVKSINPGRPAGFENAKHIREFAFPDGRKISIHRHGVHWATPLKDDPEHATLVGVEGRREAGAAEDHLYRLCCLVESLGAALIRSQASELFCLNKL